MLGSALNIILPLALIFWLIRRSSGMMGVSDKDSVVVFAKGFSLRQLAQFYMHRYRPAEVMPNFFTFQLRMLALD